MNRWFGGVLFQFGTDSEKGLRRIPRVDNMSTTDMTIKSEMDLFWSPKIFSDGL